jgi:GT2 family glycosyltransferase
MQKKDSKISIIFPSYNGAKYLKKNLDSIKNLKNIDEIELVIIDNNSIDSSLSIIESYKNEINLKLIKNKLNEGFAKACNSGARVCNGEFIFFTNQDVIFSSNFFEKLKQIYYNLRIEDEIIISPAIIFEDLTIHYYGAKNHFLGFSYTPEIGEVLRKEKIIRRTQRFSGGSLFIKKNYFLMLGGFDEDFFMYHEDTDLSLKVLRNGGKIYTTNDPFLIHQKRYHKLNKLQYYFLEHNRFILLVKNISEIRKLFPYVILTEFILLFHSLLIRRLNLRLRIYIDLIHKVKDLKIKREESRKGQKLLSYRKLSKTLDLALLGNLRNLKFFRTLLSILNKIFKFA